MSDVKVKFGAEDTGLSKTVDNIDKDLRRMEKQSVETSQKFSIGFKGMAAAAAGVAVGIGAIKLAFNVVQGTVAAFGEALDMGGRLSDLSARTGETAGKVLLLERAFTNAGSSAEKVGPTINKLQKFITDAADGAEANTLALGKLGISLSVLRDQSPTEQLRSVAQALSNIADPTERGALAMEVFGKNGGELLPFLRDFSGSLDEAKSELGSMVRIMDEKSAVFDTVSDKIQVVKGKLTEFAAGILAQTVPALELFTVALSRIDAAALGERLAKAFVGGQEAMNGFSASLQALKGGEFALSFEVAFASIKLQSKQTINEIYRNFIAGFQSIASFLTESLGSESNAFRMVSYAFSILAKEVSAMFLVAMSEVVRLIPFLSDEAADGMLKVVGRMRTETGMMKQVMAIHASEIGDDFMKAGAKFPESFKKSYDATKPLMDLKADLANVAKLQDEITKKVQSGAAVMAKTDESSKAQSELMKLRAANLERIKQLEIEIADAKASGKKQDEDLLNAQMAAAKQLERSLNSGKTMQEAQTAAGVAYAVSISNAAKEAGKVTKEMSDQLSLSAQIIAKIKEFNGKDAVDPGGKLEKKANDALAEGNVNKANRIGMKILAAEDSAAITKAFGGDRKFGKSIRDMAKEQGIDTSGKTNARLKSDLLDLTKNLKKDVNKPGEEKRNERVERGGGKVDNPMDAIKTAVEAIKTLVAKIEPKLPTAALGI